MLRDHLRGYQKDLREELYEVINRDLADYLKLSSKVCVLLSGGVGGWVGFGLVLGGREEGGHACPDTPVDTDP